MKRSFVSFWRKSIASARVAVLNHLEYRLNFFVDAYLQPILTAFVECALWMGIWSQANFTTLNGFGLNSYLAYALWATFVARVTANWQYELTMMEDIESGKINGVLLRPISFYQYYLSQFIGYKALVLFGTLSVPILVSWLLKLPFDISRVPLVLLLLFFYLIFVHTLSFSIACLCFYMTRASSVTVAKNITLWVLAGELFPLDLIPDPWGAYAKASPFASGAYVPVGYLTGRLEISTVFSAFQSIAISLGVVSIVAVVLWGSGIKRYVGTGA